MKTTLETIQSRQSVRHFTDQLVCQDNLLELVRAGMAAPSAMNVQPWYFIIVTERKILDALAEALPYAKMLFEATGAIVVCGDSENQLGHDYWIQDCAAATENILLAAEALGLGAVWTAVYPHHDRIKALSQNLDLPANIVPLNIIPIGYSADDNQSKNKWNTTKVFLNGFGQSI